MTQILTRVRGFKRVNLKQTRVRKTHKTELENISVYLMNDMEVNEAVLMMMQSKIILEVYENLVDKALQD